MSAVVVLWLVAWTPILAAYRYGTDWDLDGPCQPLVQALAKAQSDMVQCATNFSTPPKVCTNCIDQYIQFKQIEYDSHHSVNITSLDNKTCAEIFYGNYLLSYIDEISKALTSRIWEASRCESCLVIKWQFDSKNSTIEYDKKTIEFEKVLMTWRNCVEDYKSRAVSSNETICENCGKEFDSLFDYYWKIYKQPGTDFCVDVETTMNDTMNIWHSVWQCPDDTKKQKTVDITVVAISASVLAIIIVLFYLGSFIQIEREERNLVRYSRLQAQAPRGRRSRLLSSSTLEGSSHTPGSSMQG